MAEVEPRDGADRTETISVTRLPGRKELVISSDIRPHKRNVLLLSQAIVQMTEAEISRLGTPPA